jgi:hypothetical protein
MDLRIINPNPIKNLVGAILLLVLNPALFAAEMTMDVNCQTYPSPYLSDWTTNPGIVNITIHYTGSIPDTIRLEGRAVSNEHGEIVSGRSDNIIIPGGQTVRQDNRDFFNYQNIEYSDPYVDQLTRTGRLLEGTYTLHLQLVKVSTGTVITEQSCVFYILSFDQPSLIAPEDQDTIWIASPVFQWTPATSHPGFTVRYHLKVCEMGPRQTPQMAINNIAHDEQVIENAVSFIYPNTASPLEVGKTYVWQVQARDRNDISIGENEGRSEVWQFYKSVLLEPYRIAATLPPHIEVTRSVMRHDNYFEVILELRNTGPVVVDSIVMIDLNKGFQSQKVVWERGKAREDSWRMGWGRAQSEVQYVPRFQSSEVRVKPGRLPTNRDMQIRYFVVPILFAPTVLEYPTIGESFTFYYYASGTKYQPRINAYEIWFRNAAEVANALRAADYLIVTNPGRLFERDSTPDVSALLCATADLAIARRGVLGYIPLNYTAYQVQTVIRGTGIWGSKMLTGWPENGYLLLVGESEIVPAWQPSVGVTIRLSDYPYADLTGDERPELRVGRIIGKTTQALMTPIRNSLNGNYDGSDVLLVSGPEDTWEPNIKNIELAKVVTEGRGIRTAVVHTEYWSTKLGVLEEALRIRYGSEPDPVNHVLMGRPNDDPTIEQMADTLTRRLAAWLLWERLPPRGFLDPEELGYALVQGIRIRLADLSRDSLITLAPIVITDYRLNLAVREAEAIQANSDHRSGTYGWSYVYVPVSVPPRHRYWNCEWERSSAIKRNVPGKDVILFMGHGDPGGWNGTLNEWRNVGSDVEPMSFGGTNPIVVASSCNTGLYNEHDAEGRPVCIADGFLRNGAAAYLGSTEVMWYSGEMENLVNEQFWQFWSGTSRIGDVVYSLKRHVLNLGDREFAYKFNLYGDPKFGGR